MRIWLQKILSATYSSKPWGTAVDASENVVWNAAKWIVIGVGNCDLWNLPLSFVHLFFLNFILQKVSGSQQNWEQGTEIFHIPLPRHTHSLPIVTIPHQSSTFVTTDEPTLTNHYCTKFLVYIRVHFWCKSFGFGQMYNGMYHKVWTHATYFRVVLAAPKPVESQLF